MKLIVTRHGETEENLAGIMQGHLPGKLSEEGKIQAKKLARRLKDEKIDVIYSSDLARTVDTANEIAFFHKETPLLLTAELRERKHGEFEGKKRGELNEEKVSQFRSITTAPKSGESWLQVYERAQLFLDKLIHKHKNQTVLIVSHGGFIRAMVCVIKNQPPEEIFNIDKIINTSVTIFEIEEDKNHTILLYNCNQHLAN